MLFRIRLIRNQNRVYVVDIDNTLTVNQIGSAVNHIDPMPRKSLIEYILTNWYGNGRVVFLSARKFMLVYDTKSWLNSHGFKEATLKDLFLVRSAKSKLKFLSQLSLQNGEVTFIDDMSYNHENGVVLYYKDVKEEVEKLSITYLGIDFISKHQ